VRGVSKWKQVLKQRKRTKVISILAGYDREHSLRGDDGIRVIKIVASGPASYCTTPASYVEV
jgi:hypothetical protein